MNRAVHSLKVLGDSKFVIDWMTNSKSIINLDLLNLGQKLKYVSAIFQYTSFRHIFLENNDKVDSLSKDVINLEANLLFQDEYFGGVFLSHRESNFFDL
jgi:hypothetical protein